MNNRTMPKLVAGLAIMAFAGLATAQDEVSMGGRPLRMNQIPPQKMGLNEADRKAVMMIAISNMMEIKTSELALQHGSSAWTRQYAKEMIMEHTNAQEELKTLARDKGISLPQSLPADKKMALNKLASLHGARFDQTYRNIQLQGHKETETSLRKLMAQGHDADIRSLQVKLLPSVVMHRRMAIMRTTMMGPTKMQHNKA
jgi:putative membrane protein